MEKSVDIGAGLGDSGHSFLSELGVPNSPDTSSYIL